MGILDRIKQMFSGRDSSSEDAPKIPYLIHTRFNPYRLKARAADSVELIITVKNMTNEDKLTSVTVKCSGDIGFSVTTLKKSHFIRLGVMKPGEEKTVYVPVYGSSITKPKEYPLAVIVTAHFRDYDHIENAVRKKLRLRAV